MTRSYLLMHSLFRRRFWNNGALSDQDKVPIALFGAGNAGLRILSELQKNHTVTSIIDNDSKIWGQTIRSIPIISPDEFNFSSIKHVVIASMYSPEILDQLLKLGIKEDRIQIVH